MKYRKLINNKNILAIAVAAAFFGLFLNSSVSITHAQYEGDAGGYYYGDAGGYDYGYSYGDAGGYDGGYYDAGGYDYPSVYDAGGYEIGRAHV